MNIEEFNSLDIQRVREQLSDCCAVPAWTDRVATARPYSDATKLLDTAMAAFDALSPADIRQAVAAHPPIGTQVRGGDRESAWSRAEQSGAESAGTDTATAQAEANAAYERRFGHVFLIRATGRSAAEMLAEVRRRLDNDPATEAAEVAGQLRDIVDLRMRKLVST